MTRRAGAAGRQVAGDAVVGAAVAGGAVVGGSVMNSCFRTVEAGVFTNDDKTALNALY